MIWHIITKVLLLLAY